MIKPFAAVKAAFGTPGEPPVHFHQSGIDEHPEVCYDGACRRPHRAIPGATDGGGRRR